MDQPDPTAGADGPTPDTARDDAESRGLGPGATAFLGLGLSIGLCLALFVGGGVAVDSWLHWSPFGLLGGLVVGVVLAVFLVVGAVRKYL